MTAIQESGTEKFFKKTVKPGKKWILEQVGRYDVNIDLNIKPQIYFPDNFFLQVIGRAGYMEIATDDYTSKDVNCEGISMSTVEDNSETETKNTSKVLKHN